MVLPTENLLLQLSGGQGESQLVRELERAGLKLQPSELAELEEAHHVCLAHAARIELGGGALPSLMRACADSPFLFQERLAETLAQLQQVFYELRTSVPVEVPDDELISAIREHFDAFEGDLDALESLDARDIVASLQAEHFDLFEQAKREMLEARETRRWDQEVWGYDEFSDGWDGERWADDFE